MVGLYLHPPAKALVLSVDEKSQIQALDRTQPILPMRPGVPERQTHDYTRAGATHRERVAVEQFGGGASLSRLRTAGGRTPEVFGVGARAAGCLSGMVLSPASSGSRDCCIGWNAEARRRNVRFLAYNTRFLILPWVPVEHLASHILGCMASRISADWQRIYGHPIYFLETFVDPGRFRGPVTVRPTGYY